MTDDDDELYFNGIPYSKIVLHSGEWDIKYKDKNSFNTSLIRYVLIHQTPIKKLEADDLQIISIERIR